MVGRIPSLRWFLVSTFVVLQVKLVSLKSKGTTKHQQGGKRNAEFHQAHVIYQKRINEPYNSSTTQPKLLCHHRVKPHLHNHDEPSSKLNAILHCTIAHYIFQKSIFYPKSPLIGLLNHGFFDSPKFATFYKQNTHSHSKTHI